MEIEEIRSLINKKVSEGQWVSLVILSLVSLVLELSLSILSLSLILLDT